MSEQAVPEIPDKIVRAILSDVTDRSGWSHEWDSFDDDIKAEIKATWKTLISKILAKTEAENAALRSQVETLSAPVSDADKTAVLKWAHENGKTEATFEEGYNALIRSRAESGESNGPKEPK